MTDQQLVPYRPGADIDVLVDQHGEALVLRDAGVDQLGAALDWLRDQEAQSRELKSAVQRELHRRMDHERSWTLRAGDWELTGQSPDRVVYDAERLYEALQELVDQDLIAPAAMDAAVERTWSYKAKVRGINRLLKVRGAVKRAVESCATEVAPEGRRITIKRRPA